MTLDYRHFQSATEQLPQSVPSEEFQDKTAREHSSRWVAAVALGRQPLRPSSRASGCPVPLSSLRSSDSPIFAECSLRFPRGEVGYLMLSCTQGYTSSSSVRGGVGPILGRPLYDPCPEGGLGESAEAGALPAFPTMPRCARLTAEASTVGFQGGNTGSNPVGDARLRI